MPIEWVLLLCLVVAVAVFAFIRLAQFRAKVLANTAVKRQERHIRALAEGALAVSPEEYARFMADPIHPTLEGYKEWWLPYFEKRIPGMF